MLLLITQLSHLKIVLPCFRVTFPAMICSSVLSLIFLNSSFLAPGRISTSLVVSLRAGSCGKADWMPAKNQKIKKQYFNFEFFIVCRRLQGYPFSGVKIDRDPCL